MVLLEWYIIRICKVQKQSAEMSYFTFFLSELDGCHKRFKERCSANAKCMEGGPDGPQCICNEGYYGNGLHCLKISTSSGYFCKTFPYLNKIFAFISSHVCFLHF